MRYLITLIIAVSLLIQPAGSVIASPSQQGEAISRVLEGKAYFDILHKSLSDAKESIYVAIYIISIPAKESPKNPAYILVDDLIKAHKRGVRVKVLLDDTMHKVNLNAYKRLKEAGVDVSFDSARAVLHAKAVVIDSKIVMIGSFNWTRAAFYNNYEFASYIESEDQAKAVIKIIDSLPKAKGEVQLKEETGEGVNLSQELIYKLSKTLTSNAEGAFDLYLLLLREAQRQGSATIRMDYEYFGKKLGFKRFFRMHLSQAFYSLKYKYKLIGNKPWSGYVTILDYKPGEGVVLPFGYWDYGYSEKLTHRAKHLYLVALNEAKGSLNDPYWFRSGVDLSEKYSVSSRTISKGLNDLSDANLIEIYRDRPEEFGGYANRFANEYRVNRLITEEEFGERISKMADRYGIVTVQRAQRLSAALDEPKDLDKMETYVELINTYGYNRVKKANDEVAGKVRQSGFKDIDYLIMLLGRE